MCLKNIKLMRNIHDTMSRRKCQFHCVIQTYNTEKKLKPEISESHSAHGLPLDTPEEVSCPEFPESCGLQVSFREIPDLLMPWLDISLSLFIKITNENLLYSTGNSMQCSVVTWIHSPGQNTRVLSLSLLQGIFPTQGLNPCLLNCRWILYQLGHQKSPRILEWVAYPFSRASFWPRNQTGVFYIEGGLFTSWAAKEALNGKKVHCSAEETNTL